MGAWDDNQQNMNTSVEKFYTIADRGKFGLGFMAIIAIMNSDVDIKDFPNLLRCYKQISTQKAVKAAIATYEESNLRWCLYKHYLKI